MGAHTSARPGTVVITTPVSPVTHSPGVDGKRRRGRIVPVGPDDRLLFDAPLPVGAALEGTGPPVLEGDVRAVRAGSPAQRRAPPSGRWPENGRRQSPSFRLRDVIPVGKNAVHRLGNARPVDHLHPRPRIEGGDTGASVLASSRIRTPSPVMVALSAASRQRRDKQDDEDKKSGDRSSHDNPLSIWSEHGRSPATRIGWRPAGPCGRPARPGIRPKPGRSPGRPR